MKTNIVAAQHKTGAYKVVYIGDDADKALAALDTPPPGSVRIAWWRKAHPTKERKLGALDPKPAAAK